MDEKGDNVKIFETNHDWKNMSDGQRLVTFMEQKEVQRYIDDFSNGFIPYLNNSIDDLQHFINECMKIMDISEEELNKFMSDNK